MAAVQAMAAAAADVAYLLCTAPDGLADEQMLLLAGLPHLRTLNVFGGGQQVGLHATQQIDPPAEKCWPYGCLRSLHWGWTPAHGAA